jgi:hypothetical protein
MNELGELLLRDRIVSPDQLERARYTSRKLGISLRSAVVSTGAVQEMQLVQYLASVYEQRFLPESFDSAAYEIPPEVVALVPAQLATSYGIIPFSRAGSTLQVLLADPSSAQVLAQIRDSTGLSVEVILASEPVIAAALVKYYRGRPGGGLGQPGAATGQGDGAAEYLPISDPPAGPPGFGDYSRMLRAAVSGGKQAVLDHQVWHKESVMFHEANARAQKAVVALGGVLPSVPSPSAVAGSVPDVVSVINDVAGELETARASWEAEHQRLQGSLQSIQSSWERTENPRLQAALSKAQAPLAPAEAELSRAESPDAGTVGGLAFLGFCVFGVGTCICTKSLAVSEGLIVGVFGALLGGLASVPLGKNSEAAGRARLKVKEAQDGLMWATGDLRTGQSKHEKELAEAQAALAGCLARRPRLDGQDSAAQPASTG